MNTIQTLVFSSIDIGADESLYVRFFGQGGYSDLKTEKIVLSPSGICSFDTYFNAISVASWKRECPIDDLSLTLRGCGRFVVRFGLHRWGLAHRWLQETEVALDVGRTISVPVEKWSSLEGGLLYLWIFSVDGGEIQEGVFETTTKPVCDARLGIVITHFNRREWVLPAIRRLSTKLLEDTQYSDRIKLVVVDNSRNIDPSEAGAATLLPNPNLGGSGGFMRGLLHLEDEGTFTHCLFMDDDASCEIESIRRAHALLSYAKVPKFAVAGALLRDIENYRLVEKGAKFDGLCRPIASGLDMRSIHDLLVAERNHEIPDYGAWWFFAFKLSDVERYAFPFFVRGDDITFSLMNNFHIKTQIGISCWAEDFALKSGPMPLYLDIRNHLLCQATLLGQTKWKILRLTYKNFFRPQAYSYNYASLEIVNMAFEHAFSDETFWRENMDTVEIRKAVSKIRNSEKMLPTTVEQRRQFRYGPVKRRWFDKYVQKITFNGHFLPRSLHVKGPVYQHKSFYGNKDEIYRYDSVYFEYEPAKIGYKTSLDRERFMSCLKVFIKNAWRFINHFESFRDRGRGALESLTRRAFWEEVYADVQSNK